MVDVLAWTHNSSEPQALQWKCWAIRVWSSTVLGFRLVPHLKGPFVIDVLGLPFMPPRVSGHCLWVNTICLLVCNSPCS